MISSFTTFPGAIDLSTAAHTDKHHFFTSKLVYQKKSTEASARENVQQSLHKKNKMFAKVDYPDSQKSFRINDRWMLKADHPDVKHFLAWLGQTPRKPNVRVYLRSGIVNSENRKLQTKLQALGCTVIARSNQCVSA